MDLLFIGGTGNISAECAALLHSRGHRIFVLSRGRSTVPSEYRCLVADRKDSAAFRGALGELTFDVVLNLLGYELSDVETDYALFKGRVQQYVFISSATVYQKPPPRLPITEDGPFGNPFWEYAQKKLASEQWLLGKWRQESFPVTIVRPSHTYSKHWVPNPVSSSSYSFAARLEQSKPVYVPDNGENPWTLTAASDFGIGLAGLVGNMKVLGESFHITSDEVLTWNQIVRQIAESLGAPSPEIVAVPTDFICEIAPQMTGTLKGDKVHPGVFDSAKIKRFVPEFRCQKPFAVGVSESIAWLRTHPEQQNLNPEVDKLCDQVINAWRLSRRVGVPPAG
jgi:nucleoside-diphosphate-sugar epimerase